MTEQTQPVPNSGESMHDAVIALLTERKALGIQRYGTILQAHNGRDAGRDVIEELADAMVYEMQRQKEMEALKQRVRYLEGALERLSGQAQSAERALLAALAPDCGLCDGTGECQMDCAPGSWKCPACKGTGKKTPLASGSEIVDNSAGQ